MRASRQSANLGIVVEVVGGLYEGSSLASIPSCNESSLELLIGARVADVFLLRGRAADDSFILRRPSQQLPGDRAACDLGSHHDRADSPHNQKQDKRHRHDKFHTRRGPDACTATSPSQCKAVKTADCFLVQNRGSPDMRHFLLPCYPWTTG